MMMRKHVFLARAIRELPANATVIFVDAFDVLFQRPLAELVEEYHRVARPMAEAAGGAWPVIYGGEVNCWPFPHRGNIPVRRRDSDAGSSGPAAWVYRIPQDASLSANHHARWRYAYGPWSITGDAVCGEWLSQHGQVGNSSRGVETHEEAGSRRGRGQRGQGGDRDAFGQPGIAPPPPRFPFLCAGSFVGTASALRRLLRRLFALYEETHEYHDQALIQLLLLRNRSLGTVDAAGSIFFGLHGHDEFWDLERPLCRGGHFTHHPEVTAAAAAAFKARPAAPVPGYKVTFRSLSGLSPPSIRGERAALLPSILHFNGNGKRHMQRCVEEFRAEGILGGRDAGSAECTFFDHDRKAWQRYR